MGVAGSFVERPGKALLVSIQKEIQRDRGADNPPDEDDESENDEETVAANKKEIEEQRELKLFQNISGIMTTWSMWCAFQRDVIFCDLMEIDEAITRAFETGRTPLIFDTSEDDKLSTYLSYQPNVVLLEARTLIIESSKKSLVDVMDYARVRLVGAMKHGKTLVIRCGTAAPDFKSTFNDDALIARGLISAYSKEDPAVRVLEQNKRKNLLRASSEQRTAQSCSQEEEDAEDEEEELDSREARRRFFAADTTEDEDAATVDVGLAFFPREVFEQGGRTLKGGGWPERLFREEDMKPHKNFAYCRDEFRVLLVSQLPLADVNEYLFGERWGGLPLPKELFKVVSVVYEDEGGGEGAGDGDKPEAEAAAGISKTCASDDEQDDSGAAVALRSRQRRQLTSASAPALLTGTDERWFAADSNRNNNDV